MRRFIGLAACVVVCGCGAVQRADRQIADRPVRALATVTFTLAGQTHIFAIRQIEPTEWSHAAWLPVPSASTSGFTAYTERPVAEVPVLFLARRQPGVPQLSIAAVRVNSGPPVPGAVPSASAEARPLPDWCSAESWIAGFFIDGIGSAPVERVIVEYSAAGSVHRLLVDAAQNTLRGEAAFSIADRELTADSVRDGRSVGVAIASSAPDILPLVLARRGRDLFATAGADRSALHWSLTGMSTNPIEAWSLYLLAAPSGMPADRSAPPRC